MCHVVTHCVSLLVVVGVFCVVFVLVIVLWVVSVCYPRCGWLGCVDGVLVCLFLGFAALRVWFDDT